MSLVGEVSEPREFVSMEENERSIGPRSVERRETGSRSVVEKC